jgi:hypothetical protein
MKCQCRLINYNKGTTLVRKVDNGGGCPAWGQDTYGKSLYLPLSFAVNLKLL